MSKSTLQFSGSWKEKTEFHYTGTSMEIVYMEFDTKQKFKASFQVTLCKSSQKSEYMKQKDSIFSLRIKYKFSPQTVH